jgi:hypothetical protein
MPHFRQIRATVANEMPSSAARNWAGQCELIRPILSSATSADSPGASAGTRKQKMPRPPPSLVRAITL